jgi:cytochrome bd ubiquinol oxidase subunit I
MIIDTEFLSRIQFAFTVSFHILFPAFSIGLSTFLLIMEGLHLKTKNPMYLTICKFWTKIFALTFGMGVVSGIVMAFQFGTNWNGFTFAVGGVLGSLFTYEVLTAFFIEAGFLGVMLFGWDKVGPKLHFFSTCLVVFGVTLSAFWILAANSWMQTPDGAVMQSNGQFTVTDWWHVIFNHSVIPRYIHMMLAAWITTAFVIFGVSAYYLKKQLHVDFAKTCMKFSLCGLLVLTLAQGFVGDAVGLEVVKYQPIKTAAMEGVWDTQDGAPFLPFAIPDVDTEQNYWAIKIPYVAAILNTGHIHGRLIGLKSVPKADRPFVPFTFFAFRIMVYMALIMIGMVFLGLFMWWRKKLFTSRWYLTLAQWCSPIGFIALWCGWVTAETGRQPWVVYNYLRTSDASSPINIHHIIIAFALIVAVYGVVFGYFYFKYLLKVIKAGPTQDVTRDDHPFHYLGH